MKSSGEKRYAVGDECMKAIEALDFEGVNRGRRCRKNIYLIETGRGYWN